MRTLTGVQPSVAALLFLILSLTTSVLFAMRQGHLATSPDGVQPFARNYSTLVDFALLDPLVIFFVLRSMRAAQKLGVRELGWWAAVAGILGVLGMALYVHSFVDIRPGETAHLDALIPKAEWSGVSGTGWVVFAWTALFIGLCFGGLISQAFYLRRLYRLPRLESYQPLHEDDAAGVRAEVQPAIDFLGAMFSCLLIFAMFYLQDHYINHMDASVRLQLGLFVYILIATPLFLTPCWKLHLLMCKEREDMARGVDRRFKQLWPRVLADSSDSGDVSNACTLIGLREQIAKFPVWPLPVVEWTKTVAFLGGPALTLGKLVVPEKIAAVLAHF
jgi:hypothetical protein